LYYDANIVFNSCENNPGLRS